MLQYGTQYVTVCYGVAFGMLLYVVVRCGVYFGVIGGMLQYVTVKQMVCY